MRDGLNLQLWCMSHRSAPLSVRERFAFDEARQPELLRRLTEDGVIVSAVLLCTCGRTEVYCSGPDAQRVWEKVWEVFLEEAGEAEGLKERVLRFQGERALHHLFLVAAGLDSEVIGEDQILGQVKRAFSLSQKLGLCGGDFPVIFRMAVTAAKKVKTDTSLSRIPVSAASLALKRAAEELGTLRGKRMLIIGASGQIGSILLKDALAASGLMVTVAVRKRLPRGIHGTECRMVPYRERYRWMEEMDIVMSATASPHYTVTAEGLSASLKTSRKRVFFDLAVPSDMEAAIGRLPGAVYYSMSDMEELARQNNERKKDCAKEAAAILQEYEDTLLKNLIYSKNRELFEATFACLGREAGEKSPEAAVRHFLFGLKEAGTAEEFAVLVELMEKYRNG